MSLFSGLQKCRKLPWVTLWQEFHEENRRGGEHVTSKTRKVISNLLKNRNTMRKRADDDIGAETRGSDADVDSSGGGGDDDAQTGNTSTSSHERAMTSNADNSEPDKQSHKTKKRTNANRKPSYCDQEVHMCAGPARYSYYSLALPFLTQNTWET